MRGERAGRAQQSADSGRRQGSCQNRPPTANHKKYITPSSDMLLPTPTTVAGQLESRSASAYGSAGVRISDGGSPQTVLFEEMSTLSDRGAIRTSGAPEACLHFLVVAASLTVHPR